MPSCHAEVRYQDVHEINSDGNEQRPDRRSHDEQEAHHDVQHAQDWHDGDKDSCAEDAHNQIVPARATSSVMRGQQWCQCKQNSIPALKSRYK